jgi:hypothetical protein
MDRYRRLAKLLAYSALGPITGPLVAGVVRSWRGHRPVLAALYVAAIPSSLWLLTLVAAAVVPH